MEPSVKYETVGETRTDKAILCALSFEEIDDILNHFKVESFSIDDLFDVYALFEFLSLRGKRKKTSYQLYSDHAYRVFHTLTAKDLKEAKLRAGVITVFDLRDLGQSRARLEFKDL